MRYTFLLRSLSGYITGARNAYIKDVALTQDTSLTDQCYRSMADMMIIMTIMILQLSNTLHNILLMTLLILDWQLVLWIY